MREIAVSRLKTIPMPSSKGKIRSESNKAKISKTLKSKGIKPPIRKGSIMSDDQKRLISTKLKLHHALKKQQNKSISNITEV